MKTKVSIWVESGWFSPSVLEGMFLSLTALIPLHCNLFICPLATLDHEPFEIRDILDLFESQALGVAYERYTTHR